MMIIFEIVLLLLLMGLVIGSLLNLSSNPHWFVRGWDFPRVQIITVGWILGLLALLIRFCWGNSFFLPSIWFVGAAIALTLWHGFRILPYTPFFPRQAITTNAVDRRSHADDLNTIRVVISNVEQENQQFDRWLGVVNEANPDVLIVLEADSRWVDAASPLVGRYPHRVIHPQSNWYGMMMLSRLPIRQHQLRFLVQKDVPSIDATIELEPGKTIRVIAVHPRPPEPWRGNDATARDAELTIWGQELADETGPTIIGGDLNDVAWSSTSRLFLRTSGMLDPRRGRGFYNTFHAGYWFCRYPLDHVFHSPHFTVSDIQRLPPIGSDHYPMMIDLRLDPNRKLEHDVLIEKPGDQAEVDLRIERARDDDEIDGEKIDKFNG